MFVNKLIYNNIYKHLNIKKFLELIQEFYQFGLIQLKVKLISHNYCLDIQDLNTFNIFDDFVLYAKIVSK